MKYKDTVLPTLRESREILLNGWGKAKAVNQKSDSAWSIVTQVDLDVEKATRASLAQVFPEIVFVGEEGGGDRTAERFWLMDPVDGTAHYARGLPFSTSMLALIERGEVVFGVVYDFLNDDMYWAEKGSGAFRNEERISVGNRGLRNAFVSFEANNDNPISVEARALLRKKTDIVTMYCAGWEFAMVACGKLDARICLQPWGNDYDYAPGTLLVSEAGGIVRNIGSTTYDFRNLDFIASNETIFEELTEGADALFPIR